MLYLLISLSFISTTILLGLDAFRERIVQSKLKRHYSKMVQGVFALAITCIILTSVAGFIYKSNTDNTAASHLAEK